MAPHPRHSGTFPPTPSPAWTSARLCAPGPPSPRTREVCRAAGLGVLRNEHPPPRSAPPPATLTGCRARPPPLSRLWWDSPRGCVSQFCPRCHDAVQIVTPWQPAWDSALPRPPHFPAAPQSPRAAPGAPRARARCRAPQRRWRGRPSCGPGAASASPAQAPAACPGVWRKDGRRGGRLSVPRLLRACHSVTVEASLPRSTGCSGRRSSARAPGHARRQLPAASPGDLRAALQSSQTASSSPRSGFYPEALGVVHQPLVSGCSVRV